MVYLKVQDMTETSPFANVANPTVFDDRAHALAAELSGAKYCDLLTALFWVICRDSLQVASLRIEALDGELASE